MVMVISYNSTWYRKTSSVDNTSLKELLRETCQFNYWSMNIAISNLVVQAPFPKCCAKSLIFIAYNFLYCYAINDILDKLVHLNIKHLLIMCLIHIHSTRAQSRLLEIVAKWWPTLNLTAHFKVEFASSISCCIIMIFAYFSH